MEIGDLHTIDVHLCGLLQRGQRLPLSRCRFRYIGNVGYRYFAEMPRSPRSQILIIQHEVMLSSTRLQTALGRRPFQHTILPFTVTGTLDRSQSDTTLAAACILLTRAAQIEHCEPLL